MRRWRRECSYNRLWIQGDGSGYMPLLEAGATCDILHSKLVHSRSASCNQYETHLLDLAHIKDWGTAWFASHPLALYAALVVLPGFGLPASVLLVLAGVVWGPSAQTCAIALSAISFNLFWTRWLAAGPGKKIIARLLGNRWARLEQISRDDLYRLTCILRVTPGLPLFAQNYILGLLHVPILPYMAISVPLIGIWVVGFVLSGDGISHGKIGTAITGVGLLLGAVLIVRMIRSRMQTHKTH